MQFDLYASRKRPISPLFVSKNHAKKQKESPSKPCGSEGNLGDPAGIRTPDPLLKRQLLCRLSYRIMLRSV